MPRITDAAKVEHRRRLLAAAAAEFARKGFDASRVDDISVAAGLAKGTIYNYFDSKTAIFRAVVEQWAERTVEARVQLPQDTPIREQLLDIARADVSVIDEMGEFARTAMGEVFSSRSPVTEEILPAWEPVDLQIRTLIDRAQRRGELRSDRTAEELSRVFFTLMNGLLLEHWLPGSELSLDDIPELVVDYYLDGAGQR